jgi:hypothetical protein
MSVHHMPDPRKPGYVRTVSVDPACQPRAAQPDPTSPDPNARIWLLRFTDSRGDSINDSATTTGETLADVRARQAAGYWPSGRPGAWSPTDPDRWVWAD